MLQEQKHWQVPIRGIAVATRIHAKCEQLLLLLYEGDQIIRVAIHAKCKKFVLVLFLAIRKHFLLDSIHAGHKQLDHKSGNGPAGVIKSPLYTFSPTAPICKEANKIIREE